MTVVSHWRKKVSLPLSRSESTDILVWPFHAALTCRYLKLLNNHPTCPYLKRPEKWNLTSVGFIIGPEWKLSREWKDDSLGSSPICFSSSQLFQWLQPWKLFLLCWVQNAKLICPRRDFKWTMDSKETACQYATQVDYFICVPPRLSSQHDTSIKCTR